MSDTTDRASIRSSGELERERLLAAVRAREEFLEEILGSLEPFFTLDSEWRVTYANRRAAELAGLGDDIIGLDVRTNERTGADPATAEHLERAMRERVPVEFDLSDPARGFVLRGRAYPLDDGGLAVYLRDVTARVRAERALAQAEEHLRLAVEAGRFGTFDLDPQSGELRLDDAMKRLWGLAPDEQPTLEESATLIHEDDRERVTRVITAAYDPAAARSEFELDFRVVWPDGSVHWRRVRGRVQFTEGPDGTLVPVRSAGVASDIDREQEARESEERLLALMDHNPSLVFLKDEEGRYVYLNRSYQERFIGSADWRGKTDFDLWPRESAELFRANDAAVLASGHAQQFQEDSIGPDGERYVWLNYKFPFTDAEGRRYAGGIGIDVTDRVRAEEAMRESEQLLQTVLAHSRDGINMLDLRTGRYVYMNEAQVALTGFTVDEINDISAEEAYERVHPDDREISEEQNRRVAAGEDVDEPVEYRWKVKSGEYRWFSDRRRLVRDAHGTPVALVGISRDITDLKRAHDVRDRQALVVGGIATILEAALTAADEQRLGEICLQVAEYLTDSEFGFIGEVGADGKVQDLAVSDPGWRACVMEDQSGHGRLARIFEMHGLYGQVVLSGRSLMTNDPPSHPDSIGLPEGHPPLKSFLGVPLKRGGRVTGLIAVANRPGGYEDEQVQNLEAIAPVIGEAVDRRRTEEALRQNELLNAAQLERNRLARDLHDSVTQALFAATIKAEALTLDQHAAPDVTAAAEEVRRLTRGALAQMRTLLLELRADPVYEVPLQQLLRHLVEATESRASTSVRLTVRGDAQLPEDVHVTLYRVAQEALNNVARHAHAASAWVVVDLEPASARLLVGDDGVGFDPAAVPAGHLGLISMRERAEEAGAILEVTSTDQGTEVLLEWRAAEGDAGAA